MRDTTVRDRGSEAVRRATTVAVGLAAVGSAVLALNLAHSASASGATVTSGDAQGSGTDDGTATSNRGPGTRVFGGPGFGPPVATSGGSGH